MNRFFYTLLLGGLLGTILYISGCRKDLVFDNSVTVGFSTDTLHFDTTFTSTTSPTLKILLFNNSTKSVNINRLYLEKGANSYFRFGVDAQSGYEASDIVLLPNDSTYIFVSASVSASTDSLPFLVMDKLYAETDGGTSTCVIDAYGQNAIFYRDSIIGNTTWTKDLPIVLLGNVLVEQGTQLTIEPGTRIYTQLKKYILVEGTIKAIGTDEDTILFQGNRLDRDYFLDEDHPAEWGGIYLTSNSHSNELEHVYIKNATTGIRVDSATTVGHYKLKVRKSTVYNCLGAGILSLYSSVDIRNSRLISNNVNFAMYLGGELYMNHCTLGGYSTRFNPHSSANNSVSMQVFNYFINNNIIYSEDLDATILNTVVYGSLKEEASIDRVLDAAFELEMRNCLLKTEKTISEILDLTAVYDNTVLNIDPEFAEPTQRDYTYIPSSPLYRAVNSYSLPQDINDKSRSMPTDIGCEEI